MRTFIPTDPEVRRRSEKQAILARSIELGLTEEQAVEVLRRAFDLGYNVGYEDALAMVEQGYYNLAQEDERSHPEATIPLSVEAKALLAQAYSNGEFDAQTYSATRYAAIELLLREELIYSSGHFGPRDTFALTKKGLAVARTIGAP